MQLGIRSARELPDEDHWELRASAEAVHGPPAAQRTAG
jgi:hypothetical protein